MTIEMGVTYRCNLAVALRTLRGLIPRLYFRISEIGFLELSSMVTAYKPYDEFLFF